MSERQGIEIDYCPECRGIWLDRGELDKIIDRAKIEAEAYEARPTQPPAQQAQQHYQQPQQYQQPKQQDPRAQQYGSYDRGDRYDSRDSRSGYRKKKSPFDFLGDLFE